VASDRFVNWTTRKPTREEVQLVIEDYLGEMASEIRWERDRFFVTLVGKHSHPLRRIEGASPILTREPDPGWEGRYMEIWPDPDGNCLDVMTRQQDELTNRIADGLAQLFARFWEGKLDE